MYVLIICKDVASDTVIYTDVQNYSKLVRNVFFHRAVC
ncbi:hypothetical protein H312_03260 [Anncaliia algerae PRA339]|uniref:Uncharacterized protein n=1 Tax=Anncaliia algerae PRA339 TaxID=1288291 RepID=A0A059EWV3_9MICR|nr:hypothetical protein H312_03260 [Anncaliia algerae PRA339]